MAAFTFSLVAATRYTFTDLEACKHVSKNVQSSYSRLNILLCSFEEGICAVCCHAQRRAHEGICSVSRLKKIRSNLGTSALTCNPFIHGTKIACNHFPWRKQCTIFVSPEYSDFPWGHKKDASVFCEKFAQFLRALNCKSQHNLSKSNPRS